MAGSMTDSMRVTAARRLGHYGKALFCGGLTIAVLFTIPAGRQSLTWHSTSLRKLTSVSEPRVEPTEVSKVDLQASSEVSKVEAQPTEEYVPPEGIFNPEIPRDRPLDIVIAYFKGAVSRWNRPLAVLQKLQPFWIMYRKDEVDQDEEIWDKMPMNRIYRMPNVGREGHTFLHHIFERYDELAEHTLFCQETPHHPERIEERMRHHFRSTTGMMGLGGEMEVDCDGDLYGQFSHLSSVWAIFTQKICDGPFQATLGGCFIVSRQRIHAHDIKLYRYMLELMERSGEQFARPIIKGKPNAQPPSSPALGYVLERAWNFIFDCARPSSDGPQCLDEDVKARSSRRLTADDTVLRQLQEYMRTSGLEAAS